MAWKKGQSGNPRGRPKRGTAISDALRRIVDPEVLAQRLYLLAQSSNDPSALAATNQILDRLEGKAKQHLTVERAENPLEELTDAQLDELEGRLRLQLTGQVIDVSSDD